VDRYWEEHGPKPEIDTPKNRPGRKRNMSTPGSEGAATKKRRQNPGGENTPIPERLNGASSWKPPTDLDSWDDKVAEVETVEKTDKGLILVYLHWYRK
jgi:hypothetical protein